MLNIITMNVDPKIKILFFFVKDPNADVIKDFSVSFTYLFHCLTK